jgi:DNA-binding PadR family transcriptional regulator
MSVRLIVLGVLDERQTHGYEIKEIARSWNLNKWADISYGSIYHALTALQNEGLIQEVGTEQSGGRPPRSIYRITDQGRTVFLQLLREACTIGHLGKHPINLALTFIAKLPPEERVALLEERLLQLEADYKILREIREQLRPIEPQAPWVIATLDHDLGHCAFEIDWTRRLLQQVAAWVPRSGHPRRGATAEVGSGGLPSSDSLSSA